MNMYQNNRIRHQQENNLEENKLDNKASEQKSTDKEIHQRDEKGARRFTRQAKIVRQLERNQLIE